jgi:four helix bundle protein
MKSHNDLKVYQEAMDLVVEIYSITNNFPDSERFGLIGQIRRCSVSIP